FITAEAIKRRSFHKPHLTPVEQDYFRIAVDPARIHWPQLSPVPDSSLRRAAEGTRWFIRQSRDWEELLDRGCLDVDDIGVGLIWTLQPKNAGTVMGDGEGRVGVDQAGRAAEAREENMRITESQFAAGLLDGDRHDVFS